jgi:hypothetical protein|tara:strand:+ start:769 stop:918 length:150 start_codon:yes stop_codon:yes gene_type:complete
MTNIFIEPKEFAAICKERGVTWEEVEEAYANDNLVPASWISAVQIEMAA